MQELRNDRVFSLAIFKELQPDNNFDMTLAIKLDLSIRPQMAWVTIGDRTKEYKYHFIKGMTLDQIIRDHERKL